MCGHWSVTEVAVLVVSYCNRLRPIGTGLRVPEGVAGISSGNARLSLLYAFGNNLSRTTTLVCAEVDDDSVSDLEYYYRMCTSNDRANNASG